MHCSSQQLLKFFKVSKNFGPKRVLEDLSLVINIGQKIALVGENGSGKTTLAKLAAKLEFPDCGVIDLKKECTLGYLAQENGVENGAFSIGDFFRNSSVALAKVTSEIKALEKILSEASSQEEIASAMIRWDALYTEFISLNGYAITERAKEMLDELGLRIPLERPILSLSGGEKRKVKLAALMLTSPDLMILDEPTNHLQPSSKKWLQEWIVNTKSAVLLISHDRDFLNKTVNGILELTPPPTGLVFYSGGYSQYLISKAKGQQLKLEAFKYQRRQVEFLKKSLNSDKLCRKNPSQCKDRNTMAYNARGEKHLKSKKRVILQAKAKLLDLEKKKLENPGPIGDFGISFDPITFKGHDFISIEKITIKVEDSVLLAGLDLEIKPGSRIILDGPNGCGKSSLLRLLSKKMQPECGVIIYSSQTVIGYLEQEPAFQGREESILEFMRRRFSLSEDRLYGLLIQFGLISRNVIKQPLETLSLGQQRRLQLLQLTLSRANVLLLDEPTNHLAPDVIDAFEESLSSFPGAVIAATHDLKFAESIGKSYIKW